jgi:hypothetical protein
LLPPAIEGEADINRACFSLNGCGRNRDTQSIIFFKSPGMEALYSGLRYQIPAMLSSGGGS